jgi:hypothetical protein
MMTEMNGSEAVLARLEALDALARAQEARIASLESQAGHHTAARATRTVVADPMAPLTIREPKRPSDSRS